MCVWVHARLLNCFLFRLTVVWLLINFLSNLRYAEFRMLSPHGSHSCDTYLPHPDKDPAIVRAHPPTSPHHQTARAMMTPCPRWPRGWRDLNADTWRPRVGRSRRERVRRCQGGKGSVGGREVEEGKERFGLQLFLGTLLVRKANFAITAPSCCWCLHCSYCC